MSEEFSGISLREIDLVRIRKIITFGKEKNLIDYQSNTITEFTKNLIQNGYIVDFIEGVRIDTNHKINIYAATYYCQEESTSGNENNKQETAIEIAMNDGKFSVMTNINKKCSDDINVSERRKFIIEDRNEQALAIKILSGECNPENVYNNLLKRELISDDHQYKVYNKYNEQNFVDFVYLATVGYLRYNKDLISKDLLSYLSSNIDFDLEDMSLSGLCIDHL